MILDTLYKSKGIKITLRHDCNLDIKNIFGLVKTLFELIKTLLETGKNTWADKILFKNLHPGRTI